MANKGKKAVPPTVTVKQGVPTPRHTEEAWVVRVNGEVVQAYPLTEDGKRAALRHKDRALADWRAAQREPRSAAACQSFGAAYGGPTAPASEIPFADYAAHTDAATRAKDLL
jgi:hypothetical protein